MLDSRQKRIIWASTGIGEAPDPPAPEFWSIVIWSDHRSLLLVHGSWDGRIFQARLLTLSKDVSQAGAFISHGYNGLLQPSTTGKSPEVPRIFAELTFNTRFPAIQWRWMQPRWVSTNGDFIPRLSCYVLWWGEKRIPRSRPGWWQRWRSRSYQRRG